MESGKGRWSTLDAWRGLTVFLMVPVNAGMVFARIPAWLKHAPGAGMNLADFIMPAFLLALGFSSSLSLPARLARDGLARTCLHALRRYGLLFVFGSIGYAFVWEGRAWEILQMLGLTGALAFPFLFLPPLARLGAGIGLAILVEALRPPYFDAAYRAWYASGIGGPAGTFALAVLPILASALGEVLAGRPWRSRALGAAAAGATLLALGLIASSFAAPDKHLLTPAYLLIASGAALLALALLELPSAFLGDLPILGPLGRNPLVGYMASGVLILVARALVPAEAPAVVAWAVTAGILAIILLSTIVMDRRRLWVRL
jgi:predicted acyltransferase